MSQTGLEMLKAVEKFNENYSHSPWVWVLALIVVLVIWGGGGGGGRNGPNRTSWYDDAWRQCVHSCPIESKCKEYGCVPTSW